MHAPSNHHSRICHSLVSGTTCDDPHPGNRLASTSDHTGEGQANHQHLQRMKGFRVTTVQDFNTSSFAAKQTTPPKYGLQHWAVNTELYPTMDAYGWEAEWQRNQRVQSSHAIARHDSNALETRSRNLSRRRMGAHGIPHRAFSDGKSPMKKPKPYQGRIIH